MQNGMSKLSSLIHQEVTQIEQNVTELIKLRIRKRVLGRVGVAAAILLGFISLIGLAAY
jgi:hypothetical protein